MCANLLNLEKDITLLERSGIPYLHVDIMDFNFVPNLTIGFDLLNQLDRFPMLKDIHLMVKDVEKAIDRIHLRPGNTISFHLESTTNIDYIIDKINAKGYRAGLVLSPETPVSAIEPYINKVALIYIMCVQPGYAGQQFINNSYKKVISLKGILNNMSSPPLIGVDGGIGFEQIREFDNLGVDIFVLGTSTLFKHNLALQLAKLESFTNSYHGYDIYSV